MTVLRALLNWRGKDQETRCVDGWRKNYDGWIEELRQDLERKVPLYFYRI